MASGRIREYLATLSDLLHSGAHDDLVMADISRRFKFEHNQFSDSSRDNAYEDVVLLLVRHRRFHNSCTVFERMLDEGLIPTPSLRTKMSAVIVYSAIQQSNTPMEALRQAFTREAFDEESLRALIELFPLKALQPKLLMAVVNTFLLSRGSGYDPPPSFIMLLGELSARFGPEIEQFIGTFDHLKTDEDISPMLPENVDTSTSTPKPTSGSSNHEIYTSAIEALTSIDPSNVSEFLSVINRMAATGIQPSISTVNSLLKLLMVKQQYFKVFQFYGVLLEKRSPRLTPNASTYSIVFNAILKTRASHQRNRRNRKHKAPSNVMGARQVFKEMYECHLIKTRGKRNTKSDVFNVRVLNTALRTFMWDKDYAGAYVVVRAYGLLGFRPNVRTYLRVLQPLLGRVKTDIFQAGGIGSDMGWTSRLLEMEGVIEEPWDWEEKKGLKGFAMEVEVVRRLLKYGLRGGEVEDGDDLEAMISDDASGGGGDGEEEVDKEEVIGFRRRIMEKLEGLFLHFPKGSGASQKGDKRKDIEDEIETMKAELDPDGSLTAILDGEDVSSVAARRRHLEKSTSSSKKPTYAIPTLSMLLASASSVREVLPIYFDSVPLERILKYTIMATVVSPPTEGPSHYDVSLQDQKPISLVDTPRRIMSDMIREAKGEMIPDTSELGVSRRIRAKTDERDGRWRLLKNTKRRPDIRRGGRVHS